LICDYYFIIFFFQNTKKVFFFKVKIPFQLALFVHQFDGRSFPCKFFDYNKFLGINFFKANNIKFVMIKISIVRFDQALECWMCFGKMFVESSFFFYSLLANLAFYSIKILGNFNFFIFKVKNFLKKLWCDKRLKNLDWDFLTRAKILFCKFHIIIILRWFELKNNICKLSKDFYFNIVVHLQSIQIKLRKSNGIQIYLMKFAKCLFYKILNKITEFADWVQLLIFCTI
jgi:hypothetical protein